MGGGTGGAGDLGGGLGGMLAPGGRGGSCGGGGDGSGSDGDGGGGGDGSGSVLQTLHVTGQRIRTCEPNIGSLQCVARVEHVAQKPHVLGQ